jgi:GT2 family glycosyltransferase
MLSIVIVNWNSQDFLIRCLNSIRSSCENLEYEVVIIDNNSKQFDAASIQTICPETTLIQNKVNVGFSAANNQGANIAKGKYLLFLNPDTCVKNDAIHRLFYILERNNYVASGPKLLESDGSIQVMCARRFPSLSGVFFNLFMLERLFPKHNSFGRNLMSYWNHLDSREVECISGACIMIRADFFRKAQGFDTSYLFYAEDIDLCYKIHLNNEKIFYCSEAEVIHYGMGSTNKSKKAGIFYELILFYTLRQFFLKRKGFFKSLIFNLIAFFAGIFRLIIIAVFGPLKRFKYGSDYSPFVIMKYIQIVNISCGSFNFKNIESFFSEGSTY